MNKRECIEKRTQEVIELLKKHNPKVRDDCRKLGIRLTFVSAGAFRNVYKIQGIPYLLKFPYSKSSTYIRHAKAEIKTLRRIRDLVKYKDLRQFLPDTPYMNIRTGVIMVKKYQTQDIENGTTIAYLLNLLSRRYSKDHGATSNDVHSANIGMDEDNDIKIIDFGYFMAEGH